MFCFRKDRGAISVFLVMILVPCMLIASIFVDISRVQLSKAVAESSADLALSTLMANYDYDLSEYYGLMGSCQNIGEYYAMAAEFYDVSLHSRDVEDEEIRLLYQRVINDMGTGSGDETISDILRVQNRTQGALITPLEGGNMYNATVLQEQIVEFMKYRGPIVIAQEIIEKINSDPGVRDLEGSDENKELVDNKTDFYKAEGELLKAAFDVYWLTRDYTDAVGNNGEHMSAGKLEEYARNMENYRTAYGEIHRYLVGNLFNTGSLTGVYSRITVDLDAYKEDYDKTSTDIYSRKEEPAPPPAATPEQGETAAPASTPAPPQEPVYYIDGDKVTALLEELATARDEFVTAKNDYIDGCGNLMETLPGPGDSDAHAVQWWVRMNEAVNSSTGTNYTAQLRSKADALVRAYAKVLVMADCEPGNNMPADWENERTRLINDVKSLHGQYLVPGETNATDKYLNAVNRLEQVSAANLDKLSAVNLYVAVDGQNRSLESALAYIRGQLDSMQKDVLLYEGLLDKLLNASPDAPAPVDNLYDLAGTYASTLHDWSDTANVSDTNMAKDDREEIDDLKNLRDADHGSTEICMTIDRNAVGEMKTRLTNIREQYRIIDSAIGEMKYGNTRLLDILDVAALKTCAGTAVQADSIGLTNQAVRAYADSTFSRLFLPAEGNIAALHDISDKAYDPLMSPYTGQTDTPELYIYMHSKFKDTSRDKVEKEEQDQKDAQEAKEKKEKEKDKERYYGGGTDITPTAASQGGEFNFSDSMLTGLITFISNLSKGNIDNIRDNIYATAYIMEMFSFATFENEGKYDLQGDEKTALKLSNYTDAYRESEGAPEQEGTWLSANTKDSYNKTLTNRLINKDNNAAYLAEVEYILYGKSNSESVKAAYNDIYLIRYAVNLVSAFANFWNGNNNTSKAINGVAAFISSLTAGVIPAALTKVILLPILTTFETCKDLDRLEAGFPVELYKQAGDWWYSFETGESQGSGQDWEKKKVGDFMRELTGIMPDNRLNPDKGLQYSDYLTLFVYLGLQREDDMSEKMYLRMADVIQANMRKATDKSDYSLADTQVYFRLRAKLRVEPLMLSLPYYTDYVEDPAMKDDWCTFEVETIRGY